MKKHEQVIIIGGGLSGLSLSYFLSKKGTSSIILEASDRLGGRIQTIEGNLNTPLELGATWFSDIHTHMLDLLKELNLKKYTQYAEGISLFQTKSFEPPQKFFVPESESPSYRIVGGTERLIHTLSSQISAKYIELNTQVISIRTENNTLTIDTANGKQFTAEKVVLCLPPQLAGNKINFSPELPSSFSRILPSVQTWMAGSIKFVLEYERPFWRDNKYSGMLYSHSGIVTEMYDHTNFEEDKFGFTGFLNGGAVTYPQDVRRQTVLKQLEQLLGPEAANPVSYFDKIWSNKFISGETQTIQRPHQNNGHPLLQKGYLNNRLFFSGTESSTVFPGYMDGAINSAKVTAERLLEEA